MTKEELWQTLLKEYPERMNRAAEGGMHHGSDDLQDFLDKLQDTLINCSVADGRSGVANPYEQIVEDLGVLLCAAQRISGIKARHKWES